MTKRLTLTPIVNEKPALKAFANLQTGSSRFVGSLAGVGAKGKGSFGGLAAAMAASGLPGQFSQLQGLLSGVSSGLDQLGGKRVNFGKILGGAGIGAAALGGVAESLASPLEAARAQLDQSIKNAGGNSAALAKPIAVEQKSMERLGFTYADTDQSLSKLTQTFGSGRKAISEEGLVADLAARNHTDLASATDLVSKSFAKSPMVLRQFGINLSDTTAKGKAAVSAQKAHGKAQDDLSKARQRLAQLEARLGASSSAQDSKTAKQRQSNAAAVGAAQDELAAAGQHLQDVEAKLREGHTSAASAQAQLESAQNRVAAASKRLTDAEGKGVTVAGLSVSQQQELANAHGAVDDAQKKATLTGYVAATSAKDLNRANLSGDQILDMLRKKTEGLAAAQSKTFGGDLRKWKAQVIDFGATWGEKFAKPLIAIGPALAGVGALIETGFFGKIGKGVVGLTKGIGSVGRSVGGLVGIAGKPTPITTGAPPVQPVSAAGEEGLQSAAGALGRSAAALQAAADTLSAAGRLESGAASGLDASAGQLDASARLESGAAGALDESAGLLKGSAGAQDVGGVKGAAGATAASRGAGGVLGGLSLPELGVTASKLVGPASLAVAVVLLSRKPGNKAEALTEYAGLAKQIHGGTIPPTLVPQVGAREKAAWPGYRFAKTGYQDPRGKFHKWSHKGTPKDLLEPRMLYAGYAAGGVVSARAGGATVTVAEGGQDEIIGSAPTIVSALEQALGVHAGRRSGPDVAHYHAGTIQMNNVTIRAANLSDLVKQLNAETRRANFAGHGPAGGSDL